MAGVRRVQVIGNPISGRASSGVVLRILCRLMREAGYCVDVHTTHGTGDARRIAGECCRRNAIALVVSGGDGTISEVVDGMIGEGVPILVVPRGTENLLAKYIQSRCNAQWLWRVFQQGRQVRLDVGQYNGKRFLLVAGAGSDAEIVRLLSLRRRGHITHLSYVAPMLRTFWTYRPPNLTVEADGELIHQGPGWVLLGNVPQYALGLSFLHRARPDDGLLDVCVFRYQRPIRLLWQAMKVLWRGQARGHDVVYNQARCIRIRSDRPTPMQVDGDFVGWLPAEFTLAPVGVRFFVDKCWHIAGDDK